MTETFAGAIDFALTGGSLRSSSNECQMVSGGSSSGYLSLPSNSTIEAAFLYWAGSGSNVDNTVTFAGQTVVADQTYTATFPYSGSNFEFFGAKADVTSLISGNSANYNFSDLTFNYGDNSVYCPNSIVMGGWALVVVFDHPGEPRRVVNIFDGFQIFQGSAITLTPNNFVIDSDPATKQGHHAHITWEGDAGNSQDNNGYSEALRFNGNLLTDAYNPTNNQFNSYSNQIGATSGVDIDSYQIGRYLTTGDTSATTVYSSGQDLVFLTAEILSVPNQPVADLQLSGSGSQSVIRGSTATYTLSAKNKGPDTATPGTTVTIPITDGLTLDSYSGTGWSCSSSSSLVTCTLSQNLIDEATAPDLVLAFDTSTTSSDSIDLTATIAGTLFDNKSSNNSTILQLAIGSPDLTSSTKTVDYSSMAATLSQGSSINYVITLTNTGNLAATASVTDQLPADISSFTLSSVPGGATSAIYPAPAGTNGAGYFVVSNIAVAAGASVQIQLEAIIADDAVDGNTITNTATISDGINADFNVSSETLSVGQVTSPNGNKPLYLQTDNTLTRTASTDSNSYIDINDGNSASWSLTPALQTDLRMDLSQPIDVQIWMRSLDGWGGSSRNHDITLTLYADTTEVASAFYNNVSINRNSFNLETFQLTMAASAPSVINAGSSLRLVIEQTDNDRWNNRRLRILMTNGSDASMVALNSYTVIKVDSIGAYTAAYPGGSQLADVMETSTIYFRAIVSDPFGYADIRETRWTVIDNSGTTLIDNQVLTPVASANASNVYEYGPFTVPDETAVGNWTITLNADEGYEGIVSARRSAIIPIVGRPQPVVIKTVETLWDPINLFDNPKAIPGSEVLYTVTVRNEGDGEITADSISLVDPIEDLVPLFVGNLDGGSPVKFTDSSSAPSGLSYSFTSLGDTSDDLDFSTNGTDFSYDPSSEADASNYNSNVRYLRFRPKGTMNAASGTTYPEFTFQYKVKVE